MEIRAFGAGPPVVFFHGCPTATDVLDDLARAVAAAGRRALVVSSPGYGASPPLPRSFSASDWHEAFAAEVARAAGPGAWLVGFSSGAYHALAIAGDARVRAAGVFSLSGTYGPASAEERAQFDGFADAVRAGADLRGVASARFLSDSFRADHPEAVAKVEAWLGATPAENLVAELHAIAKAPQLLERVAALTVPVFARAGSADVATPKDRSEAIVRAAARGTLQLVPGAGHALMLEDGAATASALVAAVTGR